MGIPVRVTREPGGTPIGESIRTILLRPDNSEIAALTELLLYGACRAQHVRQVIWPALERGEVVLCDRFSDATLAYQGHGRGLDLDLVRQVNLTSSEGLCPDLTLLLDCPVEMGLERSWERLRIEGKTGEESRFEEEDVSFHERVREGYLDIARQNLHRFYVIDGTGSPVFVKEEILKSVLPRLGLD
jgi:dTMP kinase